MPEYVSKSQTVQKDGEYSWSFSYCPQQTWEAMYIDCSNATVSIEFEQYILENDAVGRRFMELFIQKAHEGVKVFIICDMFGSSLLRNSPLVHRLRMAGGKVYFYNIISIWMVLMPWRWFPRTHTKTLFIDSSIAYTGGVCIAQRMSDWRDTHLRVTGPVIEQFRQAFDDIERRMQRKRPLKLKVLKKTGKFLYFLNHPRKNKYAVYTELSKAVYHAKSCIYITSAFFIPGRRFIRILQKAHERGIDIRILIPEHSDVAIADWVCLSHTPSFLKAGLRIFHYQKTILHSKTAIIDDSWGTVGSTNFDVISFFHNREGNIVTTDTEAIAEMKKQFFIDLQNTTELNWDGWKRVPIWKKIAGYCARILQVFF